MKKALKRPSTILLSLLPLVGAQPLQLNDSMGTAWTADYLKITGELDVDFCTTLPLKHVPKLHSHDARDYLTRAVFMALGVGFVLSRRLWK